MHGRGRFERGVRRTGALLMGALLLAVLLWSAGCVGSTSPDPTSGSLPVAPTATSTLGGGKAERSWGTSASEALAGVVERLEDRGILVRENRLAGFVAELTLESAGSGGLGTPDDPVNVVWVRHELTVARAEGMAVEDAAISVVDAGGRTIYATRRPLSVPYPGLMDDPAVNTDVARNVVRDEIGRLGLAAGMDLDSVTVTDGGAGSRFLMIRLSTPDLATANHVVAGFMRGLRDVVSAANAAGAGIRIYQVDVADFDGPLYLRFIDDWLVPDGASWWLAPGVTSGWLGR